MFTVAIPGIPFDSFALRPDGFGGFRPVGLGSGRPVGFYIAGRRVGVIMTTSLAAGFDYLLLKLLPLFSKICIGTLISQLTYDSGVCCHAAR